MFGATRVPELKKPEKVKKVAQTGSSGSKHHSTLSSQQQQQWLRIAHYLQLRKPFLQPNCSFKVPAKPDADKASGFYFSCLLFSLV